MNKEPHEARTHVKYLDRFTNIAIIVAIAVFLTLAIRGDFAIRDSRPSSPAISQELIGKIISLPGVEFSKDRGTLLIVMSIGCHFCKESLAFYKELADRFKGNVDIIAALPEPQAEARKFLHDAGVVPNQIVTANLGDMGVRGTPTVLLVDGSGRVKRVWAGRLDQQGQQALIAAVQPAR